MVFRSNFPLAYRRKKGDGLCSGLVHRLTREIFSLRAGHFISNSPHGSLVSLQSTTKPSGEAANQLSYCKVSCNTKYICMYINILLPSSLCGVQSCSQRHSCCIRQLVWQCMHHEQQVHCDDHTALQLLCTICHTGAS